MSSAEDMAAAIRASAARFAFQQAEESRTFVEQAPGVTRYVSQPIFMDVPLDVFAALELRDVKVTPKAGYPGQERATGYLGEKGAECAVYSVGYVPVVAPLPPPPPVQDWRARSGFASEASKSDAVLCAQAAGESGE